MKKLLYFCLFFLLTSCNESDDVKEGQPQAGFTLSSTALTLNETSHESEIKVTLLSMPDPAVTIRAAVSDNSEVTVEPQTATLSITNWTEGVTFRVVPLDDGIRDGDQTVQVTFTVQSSYEPEWNQVDPITVTVTIRDDGSIQTVDCEKTPDDPSCTKTVDCEKTPDDPSCPKTVDCEKTPDDPSCPKTVDCEKTPDDPSCPKTVDCEKTPDDPSCPKPVDCDKTPDDPSCPKPVDCEKTPDDPSCPKPVDCEKTPDDPSCTPIVQSCGETQEGVRIRFMAANTTSGKNQTYDEGKGIRMFQALKPDIVMIQEFNYKDNEDSDIQSMVTSAFGEDFHYYRGTGTIPNGIISRYPIISSGRWQSNKTSNRAWEWAVVDLPGDRDLLAVSVHLHSENNGSELSPLHKKIQAKQQEGNYYVVLGGDFNTRSRSGVANNLGAKSGVFAVHKYSSDPCKDDAFPVDQDGNSCTSAERDDPYDWVLFDKTLDTYEIPIGIGSHCYANGHILDSRVYADHSELADIAPVKETDSWKYATSPLENDNSQINNFQHMPVIRDIVLPQ